MSAASPSSSIPFSSPQSAELVRLLNEGRDLLARGRTADAFARAQAAYKKAPAQARVLALLGEAYAGMGQASVGIAFLRRAVAAEPRAGELHMSLGTALAGLGQFDEAAREMGQACELQPEDASARAVLAALLQRHGRAEDAERCYEQAIALDPSHADWHEALARLRHARWDETGALASRDEALRLSPARAEQLAMGFAAPSGRFDRPPSAAPLVELATPMGADELEHACAQRDLLVWDDVLADARAYRTHALSLCEAHGAQLPQTNFPGVQTPPQPCAPIMQRIADALGQRIKWDSPDHGAIRISLANNEARADVHVDSATLPHIFGGVLYLSRPEDCRGGTSFYRHRASGWDRRPDQATLRAAGYDSFLQFQKRHLPPNRRQTFAQWREQRDATWDKLFEVPMRFNRLIVFRSDFFHAVTELFGDRPENGRLVQLFHFEAGS